MTKKEQVIPLIKAGMTPNQIREATGAQLSCISLYRRQLGLKPLSRGRKKGVWSKGSKERYLYAAEMRASRMKYREIAEIIGVSHQRVHQMVKLAEAL